MSKLMNRRRAQWAREALEGFACHTLTGDDSETLVDLLTDLMHLCDQDPRYENFGEHLKVAQSHFEAEKKEVRDERPTAS